MRLDERKVEKVERARWLCGGESMLHVAYLKYVEVEYLDQRLWAAVQLGSELANWE